MLPSSAPFTLSFMHTSEVHSFWSAEEAGRAFALAAAEDFPSVMTSDAIQLEAGQTPTSLLGRCHIRQTDGDPFVQKICPKVAEHSPAHVAAFAAGVQAVLDEHGDALWTAPYTQKSLGRADGSEQSSATLTQRIDRALTGASAPAPEVLQLAGPSLLDRYMRTLRKRHPLTQTLMVFAADYIAADEIEPNDLTLASQLIALASKNARHDALAAAYLELAFSPTLSTNPRITHHMRTLAYKLALNMPAKSELGVPMVILLRAIADGRDLDEAARHAIGTIETYGNSSVRTAGNDLTAPLRMMTPRGRIIFDEVFDHTASGVEENATYYRVGFEPRSGGQVLHYTTTHFADLKDARHRLREIYDLQPDVRDVA